MWGLTEKGFKRKRYDDVKESLQERARQLFGDDINLTVRSPLGVIIMLVAWLASFLWEDAEDVYHSAYIDSAEGVQLIGVGKNMGLRPFGALKAKGTIKVNGDPGKVIDAGFVIATKDGVFFQTTSQIILGSSGEGIGSIEAVEAGSKGNVPANTITEIINPVMGVSGVINQEETKDGRDVETGTEFRKRYKDSIGKNSSSTTDAIRAALLAMETVRAAIVEENDTMEYVGDRPPKSVECFVYGGSDEALAETIRKTKAGGIQAYGTTVVQLPDIAGNMHNIGFTRVADVFVYVRVSLQTNSEFPPDGRQMVRTSIIKYIGGEDVDGAEYTGLTIDDDVIFSKVGAAIHQVPGVTDYTLEISSDGTNYVQQNISIVRQVARTDFEKVIVT